MVRRESWRRDNMPSRADFPPGWPRHRAPAFKVGDAAWYRGTWGHDAPILCTIVGVGEHHGRLAYDCRMGDGSDRWGYAEQFTPRGV